MRIEFENGSKIESIDTEYNVRGFRSRHIYCPMELSYSYKWLYENYSKFKTWVHMSTYSNKKRVRAKYMNKIIREMKWLENKINKIRY